MREQLISFLDKNEYLVKVLDEAPVITLLLPKYYDKEQRTIKYIYNQDSKQLLIKEDDKITEHLLPAYALRPFILYDILLKCQEIKYNTYLVLMLNRSKEEIHELGPLSRLTQKSHEKEGYLFRLIIESVASDWKTYLPIAQELGLKKAFQYIMEHQ